MIATPVSVIDASAFAAVLFNEPEGAAIANAMARRSMIAPRLLVYELANVCLTKIRRQPHMRDEFLAALRLDRLTHLELVDVDLDQVIRLAEEVRLSAYDASYLWLARSRGGELVTLDRRLADAYRVSPGTP